MKIHKLKSKVTLPVSLEEAWEFFATPSNLNEVTPKHLNFKILSELPDKMYQGLIIEYKVHPVLGIPLHWVTEITHIEDKKFFVDEQRFGPYAFWHHQHIFTPVDGGVEMTDIVHYKLPLGFIGDLFGGWFVKKQVEGIFTHRTKVLKEKYKFN